MEKMQEAMKDPELAKLRTDAGVDLDIFPRISFLSRVIMIKNK